MAQHQTWFKALDTVHNEGFKICTGLQYKCPPQIKPTLPFHQGQLSFRQITQQLKNFLVRVIFINKHPPLFLVIANRIF